MKKRTTNIVPSKKVTQTTWTSIYETEVNGEKRLAYVTEEQTEEGGHEVNKTIITVGKSSKIWYSIDRRELENRIDEVATEEEDRLDQYGDLPF